MCFKLCYSGQPLQENNYESARNEEDAEISGYKPRSRDGSFDTKEDTGIATAPNIITVYSVYNKLG